MKIYYSGNPEGPEIILRERANMMLSFAVHTDIKDDGRRKPNSRFRRVIKARRLGRDIVRSIKRLAKDK